MHNINYKNLFFATGLFLLASMAALWSWNTLAGLFNLPLAEYRHVIAVFILLYILKWEFTPWHRKTGHLSTSNNEPSSH